MPDLPCYVRTVVVSRHTEWIGILNIEQLVVSQKRYSGGALVFADS